MELSAASADMKQAQHLASWLHMIGFKTQRLQLANAVAFQPFWWMSIGNIGKCFENQNFTNHWTLASSVTNHQSILHLHLWSKMGTRVQIDSLKRPHRFRHHLSWLGWHWPPIVQRVDDCRLAGDVHLLTTIGHVTCIYEITIKSKTTDWKAMKVAGVLL